MRKLSRKEVIKRGPKKGKSKGNLKGKIGSETKFVTIDGVEYSHITTSLPIRNHSHVVIMVESKHSDGIVELLTEIWGKSQGKNYKDLVETRNTSSEIIDSAEKVKTKNSFVLVPKKKS